MKQIWINEMYLYYTEVQIEKVNFWFISSDPFIIAGSDFGLYHCKEVTLAEAFTKFLKEIVEPNRKYPKSIYKGSSKNISNIYSVIPKTSGDMVTITLPSKMNEDPEDNSNII